VRWIDPFACPSYRRTCFSRSIIAVIVCSLSATIACTWLIATRYTTSEIRMTLDSPKVRSLILERGRRETSSVDRYFIEPHSVQERMDHLRDMVEHPTKYFPVAGKSLRQISNNPSIHFP